MKKRILSVLLAMVMLACLLPMTALADTEVEAFNLVLMPPETGHYPPEAYAGEDEYSYSTSWLSLHVQFAETTWTYLDEYNVEHAIAYPETMKPETVYTAHIKLTLYSGYKFANPPKLTLMKQPVELETWDTAEPWHVTIKKTFPATEPLQPIEKVAVTATEPLYGANINDTVECEYHEPYTVDYAVWYNSAYVMQTSLDKYVAGETYTLTVGLRARDYAKFPTDLKAEDCVLNPDWLGEGVHPAEVRVYSDSYADLDFVWTIPDPINFFEILATEQAYGENPILYTWAESGKGYYVSETKWYDDTNLLYLDYSDILYPDHSYHLEIEVKPSAGQTLASVATATLNGVAADSADLIGGHIYIVAAPPIKEATLISTADVLYGEPVDVGLLSSDYAQTPSGVHYEIWNVVWYDDADNDIYYFYFEDGKDYKLRITLQPDHGYAFADDAKFFFNGDLVEAVADGRERILTIPFHVSSWSPIVISEGVYDLVGGVGFSDYSAEKATLKALDYAGLIKVREDGAALYCDLDMDGAEDVYCGPSEADPSFDVMYALEDRNLDGERTAALNAAALDYLKAKLAPSYYESIKFCFPPLVWNITFDPDGGSGAMPDDTVVRGLNYTLPDCTFTPPEGMMFDTWDVGAPGESVAIVANSTVKAMWKEKPAEYWTVTFDANGGSGEMGSFPVEKDSYLTLPDCVFDAPEGKEFDKWNYGAPGTSILMDSDKTIMALWKDKVYWTVSFDADGGSGEMGSYTALDGESYVLPECAFTAPEGKAFDTWDQGDPGTVIAITSNLTVKAIWKDAETWTITFEANGGSGEMAAIKVEKGKDYTLPECAFTAPEGKEFDQWNFGAPGDVITFVDNTTITALWKDKEETLANPFVDVFDDDYYYDAVLWAYYAEPQVTNGIDATPFGPDNTVTRGQAVTFLWRAMGCPEPSSTDNPFEDVAEGKYYYKAVLWAVEKGITNGTDATHFTPNQTCSTAHIITFLYRTMGIGDNGWYQVAEAWAKGAGLLDGLDITVAPKVDCPRCNVVLFLYRQLAA